MAANVLLLNSDKTEMLVLGPKKQRDLLLNLTINRDGCTVVSNKTVKDLGVTLDPDLAFDEHIKTVSRTAILHLRIIAKIKKPSVQKLCRKINPCFCHFQVRLLQCSTFWLPG